jgi:transposase
MKNGVTRMRELETLTQEELINIIYIQDAIIKELSERIKKLEGQVNKDSHNSSKPPSSDGFKKVLKTKSERGKTERTTGGQQGHKGYTLPFSENPDHVVVQELKECQSCEGSLETVQAEEYDRRQIWDLPPIKIEVTEYRAEVKTCPCCHQKQRAAFPNDITDPIRYGKRLEALMMYWHHYQLIPFDRAVEMLEDLCNHSISEGTVANMTRRLFKRLESTEEQIKRQVLQSYAVNMDETGIEKNKHLDWLHMYSTDQYTYYALHEKRGNEAMNEIDFLPEFRGTAVHDAWRSYFKYTECSHALCNAHLLRELTFLFEQEKQEWAGELHSLLREMKNQVDQKRILSLELEEEEITKLETRFDEIVHRGCELNPPAVKKEKKRGRTKQSTSRNLLDRLIHHRSSILLFLRDPQVPFGNNQAERDVRMTKVKQKISGTFRSEEGAKAFFRIRGFISTIKKQKMRVLESIQLALHDEFVLPTFKN